MHYEKQNIFQNKKTKNETIKSLKSSLREYISINLNILILHPKTFIHVKDALFITVKVCIYVNADYFTVLYQY